MNHDEIAGLLGAYALDAVGEDEAGLIEVHLAGCPRCTAELAEHREVAGMLGNMGGDASKDLWERISSQATTPPGAELATPTMLSRAASTEPTPARRHRAQRRSAVLTACALAAVVVISLLAVQIGRLDTKVNHLNAVVKMSGIRQAEQAALLDPTTKRIELASSVPGAPPAAEIVLAASGPSFLVNHSLTALSPAQTYQLWAVAAGRAVSLGLLGQRPSIAAFQFPSARHKAVFAITVERAAGVVVSRNSPVAVSSTSA